MRNCNGNTRVEEGKGGIAWEVVVGELPPKIQEAFLKGGGEASGVGKGGY